MTRLLTAFVLASTTAIAAAQERDVVLVEGTSIRVTYAEFQQWLEATRAQGGYMQRVTTLTADGQERILETIVDQRLFAAAARDAGIEPSTTLAATDPQTITQLAARYRERVLGKASEQDLRDYYLANADKFRSGARVKARHILVKTNDEAAAVLAEIRAGADFAELARRVSVDQTSRGSGGDLGWVRRNVMVRPFNDALFSLAAGQVSGVVQTGLGYHVIKAEAVDAGELASYDAIRTQVVDYATADLIAAERTRLMARYGVTIHRDLIQRGAK